MFYKHLLFYIQMMVKKQQHGKKACRPTPVSFNSKLKIRPQDRLDMFYKVLFLPMKGAF